MMGRDELFGRHILWHGGPRPGRALAHSRLKAACVGLGQRRAECQSHWPCMAPHSAPARLPVASRPGPRPDESGFLSIDLNDSVQCNCQWGSQTESQSESRTSSGAFLMRAGDSVPE